MKEFQDILNKIVNKNNLTESEAIDSMNMIMSGELTDSLIASFLTAMRMKGETIEEITGFAKVMREKAAKIDVSDYDIVDTCGTGGDSSNTFNISTASAIVAAAAGVKIAKHGNRSASSKSGSADLLEKLEFNLDSSLETIKDNIINKNLGFMFAPKHHSSMKYVMPARKEMGIRTVFNILGPLSNPANAKYQLLGVFNQNLTEKLAEVLGNLGSNHVFVVAADDGLDEISLMSKTKISEYKDGKVITFEFDPREYGFEFCKLEDLQVKNSEESKEVVLKILEGEEGPKRDIIILNTAFILLVSEKVKTIEEGIHLAQKTIDSKQALNKLHELTT